MLGRNDISTGQRVASLCRVMCALVSFVFLFLKKDSYKNGVLSRETKLKSKSSKRKTKQLQRLRGRFIIGAIFSYTKLIFFSFDQSYIWHKLVCVMLLYMSF